MKKQFFFAAAVAAFGFIGSANAADMATKGPVYKAPMAVPAHNWSGCYVGAVAGYQWGRSRQDYGGLVNGVPNAFLPTGFDMSGTYNVNGGQFGGTLGCNYQAGNWVLGVEGDGSWVHADGRSLANPAAVALGLNPVFEFTTKQRWMASTRGRVGYAWDRWLVFATGGVVFGGFDLNNQNSNLVPTATRTPSKVTKAGWIAGLGVEYAFNNAWSVKTEWLYADYGSMHYGDEPGTANGCTAGCANGDVKMHAHILRLGVNYKFY
jgi:outer membrane immunogenic protein